MKNIIKYCAIGCALIAVNGAYARPDSTGKTCSIEPNDGLCDGNTLLCPAGYYCPGHYQQIQCPEGKTSQAGATSETDCYYYIEQEDGTGKTCSVEPNDGFCYGYTLLCPAGYYCPGNYVQTACPEGKTSQQGASKEEDCYYIDSVLITIESDDTVNEETLKTSDDAVEIQTAAIFEPNTINIDWKDADGNTFESTTCEYDGSITAPTTAPTKKGYTFTGWFHISKNNVLE